MQISLKTLLAWWCGYSLFIAYHVKICLFCQASRRLRFSCLLDPFLFCLRLLPEGFYSNGHDRRKYRRWFGVSKLDPSSSFTCLVSSADRFVTATYRKRIHAKSQLNSEFSHLKLFSSTPIEYPRLRSCYTYSTTAYS